MPSSSPATGDGPPLVYVRYACRRPDAAGRVVAAIRRRTTRQLRRLLAELDLPDPSDVVGLLARISQIQGRPIRLIGMELPFESICGMLVRTDRVDVVFYDRRADQPPGTFTWHNRHCIRHEAGHLICGHEPTSVFDPAITSALLPDLSPALVRGVLGRSSFDDESEQEVEIVASLLTAAEQEAPPGTRPAVIERVDHTLGGWI